MFKPNEWNEEEEETSETPAGTDPVQMLREDHRKVQDLFQTFEESKDPEEKKNAAKEAIKELKVHAAVEEEIFYPAMRRVLEQTDILDEAAEEHHVAKLLIEELEKMDEEDERFEAKFTVLAENVKHHIREEESEMLPKADQAGIGEIGEEMAERKKELLQEYGEGASRRAFRGRRAKRATSSRRKSKNRE